MDLEELDPEVLKHMPEGCTLLSISRHGKTNWSTGYRVDVEAPDGEEHEYFLKVLDRDRADEMALGEYESEKILMEYIPEAISAPIAWGTYQNDPTRSFYLTRFRYTRELLPAFPSLLAIIKKLHEKSVSPTGKFGFHVTTFFGPPPMDNTWTDSWEEYFTREFIACVAYAQIPLGQDEELEELAKEFIVKIIPRLLRPLQTGGRNIKPTLCFGDFYDSNVQTDVETNLPFLFDPCCFYGHNEMDFQCLRAKRNALGPEFVSKYKREVGASEPVEDFDDRNCLYAMRNDLQTIGMWPQWATLTTHIKEDMRRLLAKYPHGIEDFVEPNANAEAFANNQNIEIDSTTASSVGQPQKSADGVAIHAVPT